MYLLFEWTEEREAKMHIGIYSTQEKAQVAAQMDWEQTLRDRGAEDHEIADLEWEITPDFCIGKKRVNVEEGSEESENLMYIDDPDLPYDIEGFQLDEWSSWDAVKNTSVAVSL